MIQDKKLLRVCGETELANAKQSLITMMQVRGSSECRLLKIAELPMSISSRITWRKHLKAFFTCLPGCFTLRTPDTHKPLLISNQLIQDYSENRDVHRICTILSKYQSGRESFMMRTSFGVIPAYREKWPR